MSWFSLLTFRHLTCPYPQLLYFISIMALDPSSSLNTLLGTRVFSLACVSTASVSYQGSMLVCLYRLVARLRRTCLLLIGSLARPRVRTPFWSRKHYYMIIKVRLASSYYLCLIRRSNLYGFFVISQFLDDFDNVVYTRVAYPTERRTLAY
jgi:hypothetical protein